LRQCGAQGIGAGQVVGECSHAACNDDFAGVQAAKEKAQRLEPVCIRRNEPRFSRIEYGKQRQIGFQAAFAKKDGRAEQRPARERGDRGTQRQKISSASLCQRGKILPPEHFDSRFKKLIGLFPALFPQACIQGRKGFPHPGAQITLGSNAGPGQPVKPAVLFRALDF
jgi:hypothetical protein